MTSQTAHVDTATGDEAYRSHVSLLFLCGPSGCGKTTLLNTLIGTAKDPRHFLSLFSASPSPPGSDGEEWAVAATQPAHHGDPADPHPLHTAASPQDIYTYYCVSNDGGPAITIYQVCVVHEVARVLMARESITLPALMQWYADRDDEAFLTYEAAIAKEQLDVTRGLLRMADRTAASVIEAVASKRAGWGQDEPLTVARRVLVLADRGIDPAVFALEYLQAPAPTSVIAAPAAGGDRIDGLLAHPFFEDPALVALRHMCFGGTNQNATKDTSTAPDASLTVASWALPASQLSMKVVERVNATPLPVPAALSWAPVCVVLGAHGGGVEQDGVRMTNTDGYTNTLLKVIEQFAGALQTSPHSHDNAQATPQALQHQEDARNDPAEASPPPPTGIAPPSPAALSVSAALAVSATHDRDNLSYSLGAPAGPHIIEPTIPAPTPTTSRAIIENHPIAYDDAKEGEGDNAAPDGNAVFFSAQRRPSSPSFSLSPAIEGAVEISCGALAAASGGSVLNMAACLDRQRRISTILGHLQGLW